MQIYCPKCHMGYEVNENLIPATGRRLRCGNCKEIFKFDRDGMSESVAQTESLPLSDNEENNLSSSAETSAPENEAEDNANTETVSTEETKAQNETAPTIDIKDVFERLSAQSEKLFEAEQKLPWQQRLLMQLKTMLGLNRKFNLKIITAVIAVLSLVMLYNYRYEIVRSIPFMNGVYRLAGIRAKIPGEGLEFQNVNWNYIDVGNGKVLEVKGFINNPTQRNIDIPTVHVELLDKDTILLQSMNQKPSVATLKPDSRIAVGVIVKNPSPTAKYVYLTFIDVD
mgnify:FL=1